MSGPFLNRPLVLETRGALPDGSGGFTSGWQPLGTLWADVRPRTGRDTGGAAGPLGLTAYRIVVRAAPQGAPSRPLAGQRLRDGTRFFAIRAVADYDPAGRFLQCFVEEEVAA